jgi:hypothetical protein
MIKIHSSEYRNRFQHIQHYQLKVIAFLKRRTRQFLVKMISLLVPFMPQLEIYIWKSLQTMRLPAIVR